MTIKQAITKGMIMLKSNNVESPKLKARLLLQYVLDKPRQYIIVYDNKEIDKQQQWQYFVNIEKLTKGIPLQHITHRQEFMKMDFFVDENVLIPRPDTEILVEKVIEILKNKKNTCSVLDMCTGCGAIGISIAKYIPKADVYVSDISKSALQIAKKNALKNGVENIHFILSDRFKSIYKKDFDIIVSNPPYIETDMIKDLPTEVKNEPHLALDGGSDGLDFYRTLSNQSISYLKSNGYLCLEIGYQQKEEVSKLLKNYFKNIASGFICSLHYNFCLLLVQILRII